MNYNSSRKEHFKGGNSADVFFHWGSWVKHIRNFKEVTNQVLAIYITNLKKTWVLRDFAIKLNGISIMQFYFVGVKLRARNIEWIWPINKYLPPFSRYYTEITSNCKTSVYCIQNSSGGSRTSHRVNQINIAFITSFSGRSISFLSKIYRLCLIKSKTSDRVHLGCLFSKARKLIRFNGLNGGFRHLWSQI